MAIVKRRANKFLIYKVISSVFEEAVLAVSVLWLLPELGFSVPPWLPPVLLPPAMSALAAYNVFTYRKGIEALRTEPLPGMTSMVGVEGEVVCSLAPDGTVRVRGELWTARAVAGDLGEGQRVIVVDQQRLRLVVEAADGACGAPVCHVDSN